MLKHYHSGDYLEHVANQTKSNISSFVVDGYQINFFIKEGEFGDVINSSPYFGSHGGFHLSTRPSTDFVRVSMNDLVSWLIRKQVASVTIVEDPYCDGHSKNKNHELISRLRNKSFLQHEVVNRLSYVKDVSKLDGSQTLMQSYHSKTRNCVRKFQNSGCEIETFMFQSEEYDAMLEWLAREHQKAIESKGGVAKTSSYFKSLSDQFSNERLELKIATLGGMLVAGLLNFKIENQVEYWTPVVTDTGKQVNAIYGLINDTLENIIGRDGGMLNFGGSWLSQQDLQRFKKRFGSSVVEYQYNCFIKNTILLSQADTSLLKAYPNFFVRKF